jgi:energy-converting hydrogenase Eha subunit G
LEILKKVMIVIVIIISINYGILGLIWGQVVTSVLAFFINTHYSGRFINYNTWQQIKDISPLIVIAFVSGIFIWWLNNSMIAYPDFLRLAVCGLVGVFLYLLISFALKVESLFELKRIILRK